MRFIRLIPVLFECYSIGKWRGVLAWCKYLCGVLSLPDLPLESSDFSLGAAMDKLLRSRLFRCLVCLVLVCCILANISPLKVDASAIVAGATVSAAGVFATLFAMSMGVVFVDLTANLINRLGDSFVDHVTKSTSTDNETEILKVWIEPIQVDLDSGGISQLPPDQDDDTNTWGALAGLFTLPAELKDNFLDWAKSLINGDTKVEVDDESTAIDGFMYYNGLKFKTIPTFDGFPYMLLTQMSNTNYLYYSDSPFYYDSSGKYGAACYTDGILYERSYDGYYKRWNDISQSSINCASGWSYIWTSNDIFYKNSGTIYLAESEPAQYDTITVTPDTYVGDIPSKVQENTFDDDEYELPYINPTKLWENQTDAVEALRDVATQLQNGSMTYDQYMEQIQTETNPNPGGSGSTDSGDTWEPPSDPGKFALDLSNYFPFCIPFDLYDFLACLNAEPVTPVIQWELALPGGGSYPLEIDLSPFDSVAQLLRRLQLLLFTVGLAFKTRDLIKG